MESSEKNKKKDGEIKTIVYSPVVLDLFHYGHLRILQRGQELGDLHIAGVLTDDAVQSFRRRPVSNLLERKAIAENLICVNQVMIQDSKDPTENLKRVHEIYPGAKIKLLYGSDWKDTPAKKFLDEIEGELVLQPYYERLSEVKIISYILESHKNEFRDFEDFTKYFRVKDVVFADINVKDKIISTKANTLRSLSPLLKNSKIEKSFVFTVKDWEESQKLVIDNILREFNSESLVVRSSAINEDTLSESNAGAFHSELNVDCDFDHVKRAIEKVIASYTSKNSLSKANQVLVQKHTNNIAMSGVLFTRNIGNNSPYYVINYDDTTGLTDTVTKGDSSNIIRISHFTPEDYIPEQFNDLLGSIKEIEEIIPFMSLDIEFAVNKEGDIIIFQVRPLAVNKNLNDNKDEEIRKTIQSLKQKFFDLSKRKNHLEGDFTYFGDMPDWNPAEILGDSPGFLDHSLYDYIITGDVWAKARDSQGYSNVLPARLVVLIGNKPYVDVRHTFNSFLPKTLSKSLKKKLIDFFMKKLEKNPHLQDKVEFYVLYTCYDMTFDERSRELEESGFSKQEILELKKSLINLTNNLILDSEASIKKDLADVDSMQVSRENIIEHLDKLSTPDLLLKSYELLNECKEKGTLQFSRLARLAFIGKIILKSIAKKNIISNEDYDNFLGSIKTVATDLSIDFRNLIDGKLSNNEFFSKYGHLRPGTYDITSLRYDSRKDLFDSMKSREMNISNKKFIINKELLDKIDIEIKNHGLICDSKSLMKFIEDAIVAREFSKFEFTKNLSLAIECIAKAGESLEFSREDLSYLDLNTIFHFINYHPKEIRRNWLETIEHRKKERELNHLLALPDIIFSERDFYVIKDYSAKPNFITKKSIKGVLIDLDDFKGEVPDIEGKIVMLENGDPGYDWIFTKNISGLITKYGGVASHMSIRCAEFKIPAAIGCGSALYRKLKEQKSVLLDCSRERIVMLGSL